MLGLVKYGYSLFGSISCFSNFFYSLNPLFPFFSKQFLFSLQLHSYLYGIKMV